ncbi:MAG: protein phosphatase 2C domain-containing protein [Candidatus Magasanikbacteria bacterium]|nr:protein phosphatase 2C domain-containing protein [Candidatus Magasanikbacteria bacterium]
MAKTEGPRGQDPSRVITPPDAKKEAEIFDKFDFGSAQVEAPHHPQQDYCTVVFPLAGDDYLTALVADGASWAKHAADASRMAGEWFVGEVKTLSERGEKITVEILKKVMLNINVRLLAVSRQMEAAIEKTTQRERMDEFSLRYAIDMPTTFTGIVAQDSKMFIVHLGDTRLYLFCQNRLTRLTDDETVAERKRMRGKLVTDLRDEDTLTNFLGNENAVFSVVENKIESGDVWLLVSDGVIKILADDELKNILSQPKDAQSLANDIIEAVEAKGVVDDTTAVVVRIK